MSSPKRYRILDNGGVPYEATVLPGGKGVDLVPIVPGTAKERKEEWHKVPMAKRPADWARRTKFAPIKIRNVKKVFVGKDNTCAVFPQPYCHDAPRNGNSLLIHARGSEYVLCNEQISVIDIGDDTITEFYSPIGNSATSYPYAVGRKYVYLLVSSNEYYMRKLKSAMKTKVGSRAPDMDEMIKTGSRVPELKILRMRDEMPAKGLPKLYDFAKMPAWTNRDRAVADVIAKKPDGVWVKYARTKNGDIQPAHVTLYPGAYPHYNNAKTAKTVSFDAYMRDKAAMDKLSAKLWEVERRKHVRAMTRSFASGKAAIQLSRR